MDTMVTTDAMSVLATRDGRATVRATEVAVLLATQGKATEVAVTL